MPQDIFDDDNKQETENEETTLTFDDGNTFTIGSTSSTALSITGDLIIDGGNIVFSKGGIIQGSISAEATTGSSTDTSIDTSTNTIGGWDMSSTTFTVSSEETFIKNLKFATFEVNKELMIKIWLKCGYSIDELLVGLPSQHSLEPDNSKVINKDAFNIGTIAIAIAITTDEPINIKLNFPKSFKPLLLNLMHNEKGAKKISLLRKGIRRHIRKDLGTIGAYKQPLHFRKFIRLFTEYKYLATSLEVA